jgi:hypothetical protein
MPRNTPDLAFLTGLLLLWTFVTQWLLPAFSKPPCPSGTCLPVRHPLKQAAAAAGPLRLSDAGDQNPPAADP